MGLPVSGFPNMNAVALEDGTGNNYIGTIDFLKVRGRQTCETAGRMETYRMLANVLIMMQDGYKHTEGHIRCLQNTHWQ